MFEIFAIGFALTLGWAISEGLKGHLEKESDLPFLDVGGVVEVPKSCDELISEIPGEVGGVRVSDAVGVLFRSAVSKSDADLLDSTADGLDAMNLTATAACLRARASEVRGGSTAVPSDAGVVFP
jgi:hypothetical protein